MDFLINDNIKSSDAGEFEKYINQQGLLNSSRARLAFNMLNVISGKGQYEDKEKLFNLLSHLFSDKPKMRLTEEEALSSKIFEWSDNRIGRMVRESAQDIFDIIPNVPSGSKLESETSRAAVASMCLSMIALSCKELGLNQYTFHLEDSMFGCIDTRIEISESKFKGAAKEYAKNLI